MTAEKALGVCLQVIPAGSYVLDAGAGIGEHAATFAAAGHTVAAVDYRLRAHRIRHRAIIWHEADLLGAQHEELYDLVWCSHVLEHLPNVGFALARMRGLLRPDGRLCVTVPPYKPNVVGGHVNLWTLGLLAYRLILAGFDCSFAHFGRHGYNLSAIARRDLSVHGEALASLRHDCGDIEVLASYFPAAWNAHQGFDGAAVPNVGALT